MTYKWKWTLKLAGFLLFNGAIALFGNGAIAQEKHILGKDTLPEVPSAKQYSVKREQNISFREQNFLAQSIVPDRTLGEESSNVIPNLKINNVESDRIEGGVQRGANLFHSFSEFNVENGRGAYFANPAGIENIFGRVTGANPSEILGTLGVQGNADLFLINPNGIVFGENARLDMGGSFYGSTADSILFPNGVFSAREIETEPLLTINAPIGLNIGDHPREIVNRSKVRDNSDDLIGLEVTPGKNLTLLGGNIDFEAGNATAFGGRIELGGLSAAGIIKIDENGSLNFPKNVAKADVTLSNAANVDVTGTGGGNIIVNARNLALTGEYSSSSLEAGITAESTSAEAQAGDITINATDNVTVDNSIIANKVSSGAVGNSGNIKITTDTISLTNIGQVIASTLGEGNGGNVEITATDSITIGRVSASTLGEGNKENVEITAAGSITIGSEDLQENLPSGAFSNVNSEALGNAGNVTITTESLLLTNGGSVSTVVFGRGNAGLVEITADRISIDGENSQSKIPSGAFSVVSEEGLGDAGSVTIVTDTMSLTNGGQVNAGTFGQGNAGSVEITANGISIDDNNLQGNFPSGAFTIVGEEALGDAGGVTIVTDTMSLTNGGQVNAGTFGRGNAGSVEITANGISIDGENSQGNVASGAFTIVGEEALGDAGGVTIITDTMSLTNGGQVNASTFGRGNAGDTSVIAKDLIAISGTTDNHLSGLTASALVDSGKGGNVNVLTDMLTIDDGIIAASNFNRLSRFKPGTGEPGDINIKANDLSLSNNASIDAVTQSETGNSANINLQIADNLILENSSSVSARASKQANGGNLTINTEFIIASPESSGDGNDIIASAERGNGGNININAADIFGLAQSDRLTDGNDISASSELGVEGTVEINTPEVDRSNELVELPNAPLETKIVRACAPSDTGEQSEFIIPGRGGLPPSPEAPFYSDSVAVDWITRSPQNQNPPPEVTSDSATDEPIIEAQGWIVDENNEIVLIAHNQNDAWQNLPQCQEKAQRRFGSLIQGQAPHVGRRQKAEGQNHSLLPNNSDRNFLIASTKSKGITAEVPKRISVERFEVKGNTVFDSGELTQVLAPYTNKSLSFAELLQVRSAVTDYYTKRGYITSGAYLPLQRLQDDVVTIQVVEGYLENIEITGNKRLNSDYVSSRIKKATENSLQQEELLASLQLLQQNPLIDSISAELETGTRPGASVLEVEVNEADSFRTPVLLDNRRAPSVGSFRRQLAINEGNLLGMGDNLFLAYSNTEGSNAFDGSYGFPFNASNGTIALRGGVSGSEVVEEPFSQLDILGDSHYYELSLRQPLVQTPSQEFALGITASRRNSNISSLLEQFDIPPSELSPGADEDGQTKVSALRFFQEWTNRDSNEVIAARSQFNLGLGAFDATVNDDAPDSHFLAWQGQAQWTRRLAEDTSFLLRGGLQLATTSLLPSEQFGLGGLETLRGYRQDLLLTDNAAFATAEFRLPLFRIRKINSVLQLAPFVDVGTAWNNGGEDREVTGSNTLAAIGLGLRLSLFDVTARFDWGIPLVAVDTEKNTWQENGLYFSLEYSPF